MQRTLNAYRAGAAGIAIAIMSATPSWAQVTAASPPPAAQPETAPVAAPQPSAPTNSAGLQEIVVTAQRRSETAQSVPIAISAVGAQQLKSATITETSGLSALVPGLTFARTANAGLPFLRGIGSANAGPGDESPIAIYIDGAYIPAETGNVTDLNGIERIEVLKGPQSTLFGRNATGGVIQIITRDPTTKPTVDITAGYGNYDTVTSSLYASTGLTDSLATNLAVNYSHQGDGWGKNLFNGKDVNLTSDFSIRNKWKLTLPDTTVTLSGDYMRHTTDVGVATRGFPGAREIDGQVFSGGFYDVDEDHTKRSPSEQWGGSLKVDHDLDWAHIVSITAGRRTQLQPQFFDQDATPLDVVSINIASHDQMFSQELQLLSEANSKIQWILGFYYFHDNAGYDTFQVSGAGVAPLERLSRPDQEITNSYAGYGQATINLFKDTKLTVGGRYTVDQRSFHADPTFFLPDGTVAVQPVIANHATFPKATWKAALDHKLARDVLIYGSVSRGFKSGVFDLVGAGPAPIKPEVVDAYEVGFKSEFFNHRVRLNMSAFLDNISQLQTNAFVAGEGQILLNAGKARSKGVEGELLVSATRLLQIRASGAYLDAKFVTYPGAPYFEPNPFPLGGNSVTPPNGGDAAGNFIPRSPTFTSTLGANYRIPSSVGDFALDASWYHNGGFYWDAQDRLKQPAYNLVSASLEWTSSNKHWSARAWVSNLLNEHYFSSASASALGDIATPDAPRTFGGTVGLHF